MIKCVIFDFGGVIFDSPIARLGKLEKEYTLEHNALNRHIGSSKAWKVLERGKINPSEFINMYDEELLNASHLDEKIRSISGSKVIATIASAGSEPRKPYLEAIKNLKKQHLFVAGLTNNFKTDEAGGLESQANKLMNMFDVIVESSKVGLRKPDPEIYKLVCKKVGVRPSECIFLDDIGGNLKPAKALGMLTIKVETTDEDGIGALHELELIMNRNLFSTGRKRSKL